MKKRMWLWLSFALFAVVYVRSLTFVYVDPDDASSIAYHVLGRQHSIQPPFEAFQFGMDYVLSVLPANESAVRITAKVITAAAAAGSFALLLALSFTIIGGVTHGAKMAITVALFLAAPEFIYLGLVYTPMLVGVCSILSAHLILRTQVLMKEAWREWDARDLRAATASAVLMAFGGFVRWDLCLYGAFILVDLLTFRKDSAGAVHWDWRRLIWLGSGWALAAAAIWFLMVLGSGELKWVMKNTLDALVETVGETSTGSQPDTLRALGSHAMLLTPAFVCAIVLGWISFLKTRKRVAGFIVLVMILSLFWPFRLGPKEYYVFLPLLVLTAVKGFSVVWMEGRRAGSRMALRVGFAVVLVAPWILGLGLSYGDSSWGPGFELRPFDHSASEGVRLLSIRPAAGSAFPSSEGPRPVLGHAFVLIGGEWRTLVSSLSNDRISALRYALDSKLPVLSLMHYDTFQVVELAEMGFTTTDSERWGFVDAPVARRFEHQDGRSMVLVRQKLSGLLRVPALIDSLATVSPSGRFVVWGEPGVIRTLYLISKESVEPLGPCTAVLDLPSLQSALRGMK